VHVDGAELKGKARKREKVLVTGGAGFIGSFIVDELVAQGYQVRILDNLEPQVHGPDRSPPEYLNSDAEFIQGDVRDEDAVRNALEGIDVLFHEGALVGVGQSMYQIRRYTDINTMGAAVLLDAIASGKHNVRKMIVASSMSIYGEGKYQAKDGRTLFPRLRPASQLREGQWEMLCPETGEPLKPLPTDEDKPLYPTSIYAV